jgi:hypothetical protein
MTETQKTAPRSAADHILLVVSVSLMVTGVLFGWVAFVLTRSLGSVALPVFAIVFGAVLFVTNLIVRRR